jgi:hypothetical protein
MVAAAVENVLGDWFEPIQSAVHKQVRGLSK